MKIPVLCAVILAGAASCLKTESLPPAERLYVPITITGVAPIPDAEVGDTVSTNISVQAPNLCYKLEGFDVRSSSLGVNQFEVQAIASVPNPQRADTTCPTGIYAKDSTFKFKVSTGGRYILRYYNNQQLFRADTFEVN